VSLPIALTAPAFLNRNHKIRIEELHAKSAKVAKEGKDLPRQCCPPDREWILSTSQSRVSPVPLHCNPPNRSQGAIKFSGGFLQQDALICRCRPGVVQGRLARSQAGGDDRALRDAGPWISVYERRSAFPRSALPISSERMSPFPFEGAFVAVFIDLWLHNDDAVGWLALERKSALINANQTSFHFSLEGVRSYPMRPISVAAVPIRVRIILT
jgi:hypothetical protein